MIDVIIVLVIDLLAFMIIRREVRRYRKNPGCHCSGCSGNCGGCKKSDDDF